MASPVGQTRSGMPGFPGIPAPSKNQKSERNRRPFSMKNQDPYRAMRDAPIVPTGRLMLDAYKAYLLALEEEFGGWPIDPKLHNPDRAKALLQKVLGKYYQYAKYLGYENQLGMYYQDSPVFVLDNVTLVFSQGVTEADDAFLVAIDGKVLEMAVRSFEQLGLALGSLGEMILDEMDDADDFDAEFDKKDPSTQELLDEVQEMFMARLSNFPPSHYYECEGDTKGEQIEPGQARVAGAAQIPTATMTLGAAINNQNRQKVRKA
jgi:hypothetical protein